MLPYISLQDITDLFSAYTDIMFWGAVVFLIIVILLPFKK